MVYGPQHHTTQQMVGGVAMNLGDHLEAAGPARGEVGGCRRGGQQSLLAVLLGGEVGHVTQ